MRLLAGAFLLALCAGSHAEALKPWGGGAAPALELDDLCIIR